MKKRLLIPGGILKAMYVTVPVLLFSLPIFGQKKTLGVGVVSPSPNAALHVESPTGDQGVILPRLTTAQRTATSFTSALTVNDNGLLVYDSELNSLFVWNGTAWTTAAKLVFPYADSTTAVPFGKAMLSLNYKGETAADSVNIAYFKNSSSSNKGAAVTAENAANGIALKVKRTATVGNGISLFAETHSGSGVFSNHYGTAGTAGVFQNVNLSNGSTALFVEALGAGPSLMAHKSIDGSGDGEALLALHDLTNGSAGMFQISNPANPKASIATTTQGSGAALYAENKGTADGFAGQFFISSVTNNFPAVQSSSNGPGSAFRAFQDPANGTGHGIDVYMHNTVSSGAGLWIDQKGNGQGGFINVNNASTGSPGLEVITNSTSSYAVKGTSTGTDAAGYFENTNPAAGGSALYGMSSSATGSAIGANNLGNGIALGFWQGGFHMSTSTLASGTSIPTRSGAYLITGGGPYTFGFSLTDGDTFYVFNSTASAATVAGTSIPSGAGKVFIVLGGVARGF